MSKAKSIVITVILALAVAVAAFFAAISFPVAKNVKRLNSIASNIHLGAEYSGYAYTTIYPEGVITAEEYNGLVEEYLEKSEEGDEDAEDPATQYTAVGGLFVSKDELSKREYNDVESLKAKVASDADKLSARLGKMGYSSYSVVVEDGVSIKLSVPTNFTYAAYKSYDQTSRSEDLSLASASISSLTAGGKLTLRTTDATISITNENEEAKSYDMEKRGKDDWTDTALVNGSKTYSLAGKEDASAYFKSVSSRTVGKTSVITFKFTKEGREKFKQITTLASASSSHTVYFFVGDTQLVAFSDITAPVDEKSVSLQSNSAESARNSAVTLNSAIEDGGLEVEYRDIENVKTSTATNGRLAALLTFIACIVVLVGVAVLLIVKYKKLGALTAFMSVIFALVELYALFLLKIQLTPAVLFAALILLALFVISNAIVFGEVKRLTLGGRTVQASVKEAYKNVLMTVTDIHIVLVIVAIFLAAVGKGAVAVCGLLAVIGVVASYVLYWFTRFMWYVTSSPVRDKFAFAGLKRVVYEDD